MKKLGYPDNSFKWIRPYHSVISECDKNLTAEAFRVPGEENTECVILVATDAYGMGIDNPDIKLVVQWDFPILFDLMIQRMGRTERKEGKATFVLLTSKWSRIKDSDEIDKWISKSFNGVTAGNAQFSDSNRPKAQAKTSPLNQILNVDDDVFNTSLLAALEAGSETDFDINYNDKADLISGFLAIEADETHFNQKKERKISKSEAAKRANLPDEIFDYIYVVRCQRLYSQAWYDDMTYARNNAHPKAKKALLQPCCNRPSYRSQEPDFMAREPFIDTSTPKYTESDRE